MSAAKDDDVVKLPPLRSGTGLDYLQRIIAGEYPNVPIGDTLNFRITEVESRHTTLDIRINYLRPITLDTGVVRAEGTIFPR